MFYYILDKENSTKIVDANESKTNLISLLEWLPGYSEKDILETKEEMININEGWVFKKDYKEPDEVESTEEEQENLDNNTQLQSLLNIAFSKKEENNFINDNTKISDKTLRERYIGEISKLIREACSDIIFEIYPTYKQLNLSFEDESSQERKDFLTYRDYLIKQCHNFIENLEATDETEEVMVKRLQDIQNNLMNSRHKQYILNAIGLDKYKYIYDKDEVLKLAAEE